MLIFDPYTIIKLSIQVPNVPIVFNFVPLNPGGYYDVRSGIYKVPTDGVYEFQLHIWCINDAHFGGWIVSGGIRISLRRGANSKGGCEKLLLPSANEVVER